MPEHAVDGSDKRPEREAIAERERRRGWTLFGARTPIAGAEHHGREPQVFGRERRTTGKPHFDGRSAWQMDAVQACGQGRCIVRDNEIARLQKIRQARARGVRNRAVPIDDQQACV